MKVCSVDSTLNEEIKAKDIAKLIKSNLLNVKINIIKDRFWKKGLNRKNLERSHILFITQPRKRLTKEEYIELVSYVDIGGTLILTYSDQPMNSLGRWFKNMREELGIDFGETVYGIPKVSEDTRLVGTPVSIHKAQIITTNTDPKFLRFNGIKKYVPLLELNDNPIALAAYKRRGAFVVFSSTELFRPENEVFINKLLYIILNGLSFELEEKIKKRQIGNSDFYYSLYHACFNDYLLRLYHHDFLFAKKIVNVNSKLLREWIVKTIFEVKAEGKKPKEEEIEDMIAEINYIGAKQDVN